MNSLTILQQQKFRATKQRDGFSFLIALNTIHIHFLTTSLCYRYNFACNSMKTILCRSCAWSPQRFNYGVAIQFCLMSLMPQLQRCSRENPLTVFLLHSATTKTFNGSSALNFSFGVTLYFYDSGASHFFLPLL